MALYLHIHAGRRVRTIDLTPPSLQEQYKQLVARLMEIMERQSTHDDAQPGHPFYGNQYTDVVLGPKPTEAKSKGVKNIVHELLTSGHPFTFEELKAATGAKLDQQLHNAINELKAGKHAAGALGIVKIGPGQYQVVKPNGEVAKALPKDPDDELVSVPFKDPEEKAQEAPKAAEPPNPPAEPPPIAPRSVSEAPSASLTGVAKAPATKMTKAEADKAYNDQMTAIHEEAASMMSSGDTEPKEAAEFWKKAKAKAMAQWKADTTGVDQKPNPVEVFKEDEDLVYDLALAHEAKPALMQQKIAEAMAKWKENTHAAKFGKAATPAPVEEPKATEEPFKAKKPEEKVVMSPEALKAPVSFEVPKSLVPEGHKGITTDDFVTQPGHSESGYVKGIAELHKKLHGSASDSVSNKVAVEHGLTKRLQDSPHFQNMRQQYAKTHGGSMEAAIISCWAGSSGDSNNRSVSAQLACRDVFGMDPSKTETKAFGSLQNAGGDEDAVHKKAAKEYGIDVSTPAKFESYKKGMQDFMLAQYHETQDHLSKLGIKELHLVRGMKFGAGGDPAKMVNLKLQPASSFSTAHGTAKSFSGGHSLFVVKVPASQVLGSFCTGYGCTSESEVVVLNHENLKAIQIGAQAGATTTQMSSHIKQNAHSINGAPASQKAKPAEATTPAPSASPGSFPLPPEGTGTVAKKSHQLASNGDLAGLKAHLAEVISAGIKAPKSKAYTKELIKQLEAKQPKASKPTPVTAEGVKKNAHYYKKLKEAVFNHPIHTGVLYDALKKAGYSNEQVLSTYKKAHVNQYGEPL